MANSTSPNNGIVIFAKDINRMSAFYQQTLNLSVAEQEKSHQVLSGQSTEIVIHAIPAKHAASITIENPPVLRATTAIKPAFWVDDLRTVSTSARRCGGQLKPLQSAWRIRGALVLDGNDPEGNIIQFKQLAE